MNRKIDNLNRLVIPKEMLDSLDILPGDSLEINQVDDQITLKKTNRNKNTSEILERISEYKEKLNDEKDLSDVYYNTGVLDALNWVLNIKE